MTWRRFERGGMLGNRFEVAVDGAAVIVRITSGMKRGRDVRRPFASPEAAAAEAAKLVARHLAEGYVEVSVATPVDFVSAKAEQDRLAAAEAQRLADAKHAAAIAKLEKVRASVTYVRDERLEAECRAAPDDPGPWSVYADFLLEHGDPRGILATDPAKRADLLAIHAPKLCGWHEAPPDFVYRHGFAVAGVVKGHGARQPGRDVAAATGALLSSPMGTFITELHIGLTGFGNDNNWRPTLEAIVTSPAATRIRVLRFDAYDYDDCMMHWVACGDLGDLLAQLPALEELRIRGDTLTLGALPPSLRRYVRESCTLKAAEVADLAARDWPALVDLELWFGNRDYGASAGVADLAPILAAHRVPRLRHLGIANSELAVEMIDALVKAPLLPQLESLAFVGGTFAGDEVATLVRHAAKFRHLAELSLEDNLLAPEDSARIEAVLDNVVIGGQRDDDEARYVTEYE